MNARAALDLLAAHAVVPPTSPPFICVDIGAVVVLSPPASPYRAHRVLHAFTPDDDGHVKLSVGDVVETEGEAEDDWIFGRNINSNESGWFPVNYIDLKR